MLSSRMTTLSELRAEGNRGAALLLHIKSTRVGDAISAILILNTVANTLGATLAGARAAVVFGSASVGIFSGVMTLLVMVCSEIIPKTLGAVYTRSLSSFAGWALAFLTKAMAPALVLSRGLTRLLVRGQRSRFSRGELAAVIATASREGALSADEVAVIGNLLRIEEVKVEDVMTPRTVVFMLPADATAGQLLDDPEAETFSRIPLHRGERDNVVGYVLHREVAKAVASGGERERPLHRFMREVWFIPELTTVGSALRQFLERRWRWSPTSMAASPAS
jgi:Mg2+/Co2+ transporter CorB